MAGKLRLKSPREVNASIGKPKFVVRGGEGKNPEGDPLTTAPMARGEKVFRPKNLALVANCNWNKAIEKKVVFSNSANLARTLIGGAN